MFKKYSIKEMQLIYNIVSSVSGNFEDEDNINFLITQSLHILGKRYFDKYIEMTKK